MEASPLLQYPQADDVKLMTSVSFLKCCNRAIAIRSHLEPPILPMGRKPNTLLLFTEEEKTELEPFVAVKGH